MSNTQFKIGDTFGDVISKDSMSLEQKTKPNNFLAEVG